MPAGAALETKALGLQIVPDIRMPQLIRPDPSVKP
jgi:hypothetical protein